MTQPTEQDIQKRFNELPTAVQDAINSWETSQSIQAIGKQYGLHIDQIGELAGETGLLMLGFTPIGEYVDRLMSALRISREDASHITSSINSQVLMPIRKAMQRTGEGETPKLPKKDAILESIENPELSAFGDQTGIFTSGAKITPTGNEQTRANILSQIETAGEVVTQNRIETSLPPVIKPVVEPEIPAMAVPVATASETAPETGEEKVLIDEKLLPPPEELPELAPHIETPTIPQEPKISLERRVPIVKINMPTVAPTPVAVKIAPITAQVTQNPAKPAIIPPTLNPLAEPYKAPAQTAQTIGIPIKKSPLPSKTYSSDPYREPPK